MTGLFLAALHALVPPGTKPTWQALPKADAAEPGSRGAVKFAGYVRTAGGAVEPRVRALLDGGPPDTRVVRARHPRPAEGDRTARAQTRHARTSQARTAEGDIA
ncbi:hypothetical protein [Streptomyces odontomachi]|uniref:hypothetical protein n=1 Tax=Streptomyces odontomachi TaxID=2944940 RepID=UPI0035A87901